VFAPKDRSRRYPILIERTPYGTGPYGAGKFPGEIGPSRLFVEGGYIFVHQDVRGCFMSEGTFVDVRPILPHDHKADEIDESTDAYDTIDWLVEHVPNNNGRAGLWGISYPGFYAAAGAIDAHPALKAVSPQAPLVDWFLGDDVHHNGALFLQQEFVFDAELGLPRSGPSPNPPPKIELKSRDAFGFFLGLGPLSRADGLYFKGRCPLWTDVMNHGSYDRFWKSRNLLPHLEGIRPSVLTVGGWYDAEDLYGALHTYQKIERASKAENNLVMGPWIHGNWSFGDGGSIGRVRFGSRPSAMYRERVELPFFDKHLKDKPGWKPAEAIVFETGRNLWHHLDAWPPRETVTKPIYLRAGGVLSFREPTPGAAEFDEYESDPAHPVPYTKTNTMEYPPTYMVEDQRFLAKRDDVLTYQTGPLADDLTVAGPIRAELVVSTSGTDSDWVVKLIDVHPDDAEDENLAGYQQLVRGDVMRGKFRNSFERPEPFEPGEPTVVPFTLQDVFHTFRRGHWVMVQVQSSWFPLVDRNPQTFLDIYHARESDFRKATQRVYHCPDRASRLVLPVLAK
jgi:putative CocE/NonD family hydrolase